MYSKKDIYNSIHYKKSLMISLDTHKNMIGNDKKSAKTWSHYNHHLVTCLKMMNPQLKNYLEIGSFFGYSFCTILNSGNYENHNFVSVEADIFPCEDMEIPNIDKEVREKQKYKEQNLSRPIDILKANSEKFNKNSNVTIIKGYSNDKKIIDKVKNVLDKIDILYIDGDHTYEGVAADFINYFPMVSKNGFIVFDDYLPYTRDSHKSINDIVEKYKDQLNVIGCLEDKIRCNNYKTSQYIIDRKIPFLGADINKTYNMSFIVQKIK
jgi:cephalosporin hydroxylase